MKQPFTAAWLNLFVLEYKKLTTFKGFLKK